MTPRCILVAVILIVQGCMPLPSPITRSNPDRGGIVKFTGLSGQLESAGALRILVVHGMSPHKPGYSNGLQQHLADQLGLKRESDCETINTYVSPYGSRSLVRRCAYSQSGRDVRIYELTWSDLSQQLIAERIGYDWTDHGAERVLFDQLLKAGLIDQAFGDAIVYTGKFAPTMQAAVAHAICAVMTDGRASGAGTGVGCTFAEKLLTPNRQVAAPDIALISHSLGSYMVFETLTTLINEKRATDPTRLGAQISASDFLNRLGLVAMLANQLPLLELSRIPAEPGEDTTRSLAFLRKSHLRGPIVAVSDPNDLLSFPLGPGWPTKLGDPTSNVINVTMANAEWVALAVVNPAKAHTGYFDNPCVTRLLVDGDPKCGKAPIFGLQYENLGRAQANAGMLLHARSPVSFPVLATFGVSSLGGGVGIAKSKGTFVAQARARVLRTLTNPVDAQPNATYGGAGVRLSYWTLTAGVDWLWRDAKGPAKARWAVGTGW
jgi:hypothetical protein